LAIELLTAAQAMEFRRPLKTSPQLEQVFQAFRAVIPPHEQDRILAKDIQQSAEFIRKSL
ncbi:MAG TPA: histidine ammonia-lyase, partial [Sphingobacteriaceae bacterium]